MQQTQARDQDISDGSAADQLWRLIRAAGVGPVTTSKLLARKRPKLLPVIDTVVKKTLNHARRENFWVTLRQHLLSDEERLHGLLVAARTQAGLEEAVSVIRCFDVIVWMTGKRDESRSVRGRF